MEALRRLPPLDLVLGDPSLQPMIAAIGRSATADLVRLAIDRRREDLQAGAVPAEDRDAEAALIAELTIRLDRPPLRPVINATGVVDRKSVV